MEDKCCSKEVYLALVALSEVLVSLVRMNHNYSQSVSEELDRALIYINNLIPTPRRKGWEQK